MPAKWYTISLSESAVISQEAVRLFHVYTSLSKFKVRPEIGLDFYRFRKSAESSDTDQIYNFAGLTSNKQFMN